MRAGLFALISSLAVLVVGSATSTVAGMAQLAPFCCDAQSVDWLDAFAPLSGDTVQQTGTGRW